MANSFVHMKATRATNRSGFTLVELLVVIVIIASLAAMALTLGPKMMAKAKASESMQNIRQISPLLSTYAADNSMKLPPIEGTVTQADGSTATVQWNEVCLALLYPDTDPTEFKSQAWWDRNKVVLKNPLLKPSTPLKPGYAINEMIAENLVAANPSSPDAGNPLAMSVPLALISDPARTPLIAPFNDFRYRYDAAQLSGFKQGTLKELLADGKLPILFVDGHLEVMTPGEYESRELALLPVPSA